MLHVIYRTSNGEKPDVRPNYYSKELCLRSLIRSLQHCSAWTFDLIYDGDAINVPLVELAQSVGTVSTINLQCNSGSFRYALDVATRFDADHIVYFVEDDYLHLDHAMEKLIGAFESLSFDYLTLYDHPVRYATDYKFGLDLPVPGAIEVACGYHWRSQESTCMTFAAKAHTLNEDRDIFWKYTEPAVPLDRELFRRLQGLIGYEYGGRGRRLIGPMPSPATHLHMPWLAPCVEWETVAASV